MCTILAISKDVKLNVIKIKYGFLKLIHNCIREQFDNHRSISRGCGHLN